MTEHDHFLPGRVHYGVPEGHDARLLIARARQAMAEDKIVTHIALDDTRTATLRDLIAFFAPDVELVEFPAWDCLPYDRVSPHRDVAARRVAALTRLLQWQGDQSRKPRILLTTINAAGQRVLPRAVLKNASFAAEIGDRIDLDQLQSFLTHNGYERYDTVREAGHFAVRGGIVDLFPPDYEQPLRLDLFGDELESIKRFDPESQRSGEEIIGFALTPATEIFLNDDTVARFRAAYRDAFGMVRGADPLYEAVSEGRRYDGMSHWQPLFYESMETLLDYTGPCEISADHHAADSWQERLTHIEDFYEARRSLAVAAGAKKGEDMAGVVYHPLPPDALYLSRDEAQMTLGAATSFSPFAKPEGAEGDEEGARKSRDFADLRAQPDADLWGGVSEYVSLLRREGKGRKIVLAAYSEGARARLIHMMEEAGFANLHPVEDHSALKKLHERELGIMLLPLERGFVADDLAILTEQDILGDRLARRAGKRRKADNFLREVSSLSAGDLVVHMDHGIGRFVGLETLNAAGALHDCLKIIYAGDDRLFVPVENIDMLSRFGADEGTVQLDKLGGVGWQARKAKVKRDLMVMADGLLKIAAARELQKAEKLDIELGLYNEFAARFPYQETEDQQRSIESVLADIAQEKPMDRLVCGDVGFGKTEVALRAAYVAAMSGVQVALVVPTTLLARQHYSNFVERMQGTGLRVEQLSRLVNARDSKLVKDGIRDGSVNIVIGTHALLADSVKFAHLGLLIVDEEQRFGVKQKEKLKELKSTLHVLTLTATPIPRTLQMALTGVRDLSLITTPPVDRLAVRTFVLPYDPVVVREALLREHYRGGQSFYVCPRVKDIASLEEGLKELVPEIRVISAHGQMTPADLEDRMSAFYDGQYDVLLATNIIESGLDIPRANTMIVHRADLFGLAQLYQIRGRIGRSKQRAYAYMTYAPGKSLTEGAKKRLEVLETLDTLGAGFQLASHDMDIRGAGNLLGEQQSGHIKEVGVELYQQMLEEAVAAAKAGVDDLEDTAQGGAWSPTINVGTSVLIPETYVEDLTVRMSLYRRINDLEGKEEIEGFAAEMIDRFGPLPDEVENLLQIIEIKQLCRRAGVERVDAGPKGAVISFYKDAPPDPEAVMRWMAEKGGAVKLRPDQKLLAVRQWDNAARRVKGARSLLGELAALNTVMNDTVNDTVNDV